MKTYVDNNFLVARDTIILCNNKSRSITVPDKFDKIDLLGIGERAFAEMPGLEYLRLPCGLEYIANEAFADNPDLKRIEIPGTVKKFGKDALNTCKALSEVVFYDIELSKSAYLNLKGESIETRNGVFVSNHIPSFLNDIGFSVNGTPPAVVVPKNVIALFRRKQDEVGPSTDGIYFVKEDFSNEEEALLYQINSGNCIAASLKSESINDAAVKTEKPIQKQRTCIFTFDDKKTFIKGNRAYVTVVIKYGCFFWQSAQKVICDKKEYYVYRRFYLSPMDDVEYVRENVAIYKDNRRLMNKEEERMVYGKYKLLSIL